MEVANTISSRIPNEISLHELLLNILMEGHLKDFDEEDKNILLKFGGGHYNHSFFWLCLSGSSNINDISGFLIQRIELDFGNFDNFKNDFSKKSLSVFGSGWTWLIYDHTEEVCKIVQTGLQISPIMIFKNVTLLLTLDVWEHAYYLKFKNDRSKYIEAFWNVVDWKHVSYVYESIVLGCKRFVLNDDGVVVGEEINE